MEYYPPASRFEAAYDKGEAQLVWSEFLTDLETPVSAMLKLQNESDYHLLFESVEGGASRARYSIIALCPDILWKCVDGKASVNRDFEKDEDAFVDEATDPFASLRALVQESKVTIPDELPPMATGIFGYMGYDMVKLMEKLPCKNPDPINIPQGMYMRPQVTVIFDSVKDVASIITPVYPKEGLSASGAYREAQDRISRIVDCLNSNLERSLFSRYYAEGQAAAIKVTTEVDQPAYEAVVERAKDYIRAGDIFQIVPSRRLTADFPLPPIALYRSLRHLNPSPYLFYMNFGDQAEGGFSMIGSSPEILVRVQDGKVTIRPLAGTRMRGKTPEEDDALAEELLNDEKELAEHLMLLDLGRNDVGRVAKVGTVKVTEEMKVEKYSHVMHIVSNVEGELADDKDCFDALIAGFPAGTVSGAPKIRAMEIIDELEIEKRSFYGGTAGYISAMGIMDTCITLRTGLVKGGKLYMQAGAGIVADSVPASEFIETENKVGALVAAAQKAARFL
jgi:anthranilate synthase component 1